MRKPVIKMGSRSSPPLHPALATSTLGAGALRSPFLVAEAVITVAEPDVKPVHV
jgi:hypothetical protein